MTVLKFGHKTAGLEYNPRAAAYGLLYLDTKLALVRVGLQAPYYYDLPGGGIDPGETPEMAVIREYGEETGLIVRVTDKLPVEMSQYFFNGDGVPYDNLCHLFALELIKEKPELKVEADHQLEWHDPHEAITLLRHEAHAWGLLFALRLKA
jgi:8-oxo-dGTP diphosphatase